MMNSRQLMCTVGLVSSDRPNEHPPAGADGRRLPPWLPPWLAVAAMAAMVAAFVLVVTKGSGPLPLALLISLATYIVASRLPRRLSIAAAALAAAAIGAAICYAAVSRIDTPVGADAVVGFLPLAAAWFIGDSAAARRRYLAGLAEQHERERQAEAEQARREVREERVRIAQELHDVVAHTLAVITVQAGVGRRLMARRPEEAAGALESIESIGRTAQDELRVVLGLLREEGAAAAELAPAPRLADLKALAETVRASGISVELRVAGADRQLSPALELSLYRVVQEALTNVVKHAPHAQATVDLVISDQSVRAVVADDGGAAAGYGSAAAGAGQGLRPPGHGIVGMRERVGAFGGSLAAGPEAGGGFRVVADIPIEAAR
jgi:signal transduction histidine kinase